jgi:hypothetical protein
MEDGTFRNSTVILGCDGEIRGIYNKNHLVFEEITQRGALCGKDAPVITSSQVLVRTNLICKRLHEVHYFSRST